MRRRIAWLLMVLLLPAFALAESEPKPIVHYFYENYCGSCHPDEDFHGEFRGLTGEKLTDYRYRPFNTATEAGKAQLQAVAAEFGIEAPLLPLVIVDGEVFMGNTQIQSALPAYGLARAESTVSTLYYLYVDGCADCAKAKALLDALPKTIMVVRGDYEFDSELVIRAVHILDDAPMAAALFDAYSVPEESRFAPMLLAGERYREGLSAMERFLQGGLQRGEAMDTILVDLV